VTNLCLLSLTPLALQKVLHIKVFSISRSSISLLFFLISKFSHLLMERPEARWTDVAGLKDTKLLLQKLASSVGKGTHSTFPGPTNHLLLKLSIAHTWIFYRNERKMLPSTFVWPARHWKNIACKGFGGRISPVVILFGTSNRIFIRLCFH
jgi:hypothetical protein